MDMIKTVKEVNGLLDPFNEETDFPVSYDEGINLDTLMKGLEVYTNEKVYKMVEVDYNDGLLLNGYYKIEQWQ
jgi:hypothetical protein